MSTPGYLVQDVPTAWGIYATGLSVEIVNRDDLGCLVSTGTKQFRVPTSHVKFGAPTHACCAHCAARLPIGREDNLCMWCRRVVTNVRRRRVSS